MKYILLSVVFLSIFGCKWLKPRKELKTPEEVTVAYYKALYNLEFDEAAYYCEEGTAKAIELLSPTGLNLTDERQAESKRQSKFIQAATCKITGDLATCRVCCGENGAFFQDRPTTLLRDKVRHWLVVIYKHSDEVTETPTPTPEPVPEDIN